MGEAMTETISIRAKRSRDIQKGEGAKTLDELFGMLDGIREKHVKFMTPEERIVQRQAAILAKLTLEDRGKWREINENHM